MRDPGDLVEVGEISIPYFCETCGYQVGVRAILYTAGIAEPLEDTPVVCPGCESETVWLTEEEQRSRA